MHQRAGLKVQKGVWALRWIRSQIRVIAEFSKARDNGSMKVSYASVALPEQRGSTPPARQL